MVRLLTPFILFIFGLIISIYSYLTYADFDTYGAAFYPTIIGGLVSSFSLIDFLMELNMRKSYVFRSFNFYRELLAMIVVAGGVLFYILLSDILGFILTVSLILIMMSVSLVKKNKILTAIFLVFVAMAIYLLFAKVLQVSLPAGILFE